MALPFALSLFGPTASGKSGFALALARALREQGVSVEIINADSRQVYKYMPLLAACPSVADYAAVPHHAYEFLEPGEPFSVVAWCARAVAAMEDIWHRGGVPLLVGGTGFYLDTLMRGLSPVPEVPHGFAGAHAGLEVAELRAALADADPVLFASLDGTPEGMNPARLLRALKVGEFTGVPLSVWRAQPRAPFVEARWLKLALDPPVEVIRHNITKRWEAAVEQGIAQEAAALPEAPFDHMPIDTPTWQAVVRGELTVREAMDEVVARNMDYVKRQRTWLRGQYTPDVAVSDAADSKTLSDTVQRILAKHRAQA